MCDLLIWELLSTKFQVSQGSDSKNNLNVETYQTRTHYQTRFAQDDIFQKAAHFLFVTHVCL